MKICDPNIESNNVVSGIVRLPIVKKAIELT